MAMMTLPDPLPLVGRTEELAEMEALLESGDAGASVVFLRGEGGVGKSRIATELGARAVRRSWKVVKGRAYPAETGVPYAPFSDAWLPLLRGLDPNALSVLSRGGQAELGQLFPALALGSNDDEPHAIGAPDELRTRLMWNFAEFVKRLAARGPLLCILEDMQWADDSSLHLVHFLARQTRGTPVRFVLTYNDQERDRNPQLIQTERSLDSMGVAHVRRLDPLTLEQVHELVTRSFAVSGEAVREFSAVLFGWTRGNAFFVEEIVTSLVETGQLRSEAGTWVGWDAKDFAMPGSIRDAVIGRTRNLSADAQGLAILAAIVGSRVSHGLLGSISELPDAALLTALEELCARGILDESVESSDIVYNFAHPLVREILYGELGLARARQQHGRVAEAMEAHYGPDAYQHADELAFHFARTDGATRAKAVRYLAAAGRKALERRADHEAINYLKAALERVGGSASEGGPSHAELVPLLARAHTHVGDFDAAVDLWERALVATPPDRPEHAAVRRALGMTYFWLGRHDEAHRHFDAGTEVARARGDEHATVRLIVAKAHCLHELGRGVAALETLQPALPIAERIGDPNLLARVHRGLALLHVWIGPPAEAEAHAERAIELAARVGDVSIEFWARWGLAVLWGMRGDTDRMTETIEQINALADRARSPVLRLWTADMVVELAYGRGEWDRGIEAGEQAIALARSLNQRSILPRLLVWTSQFFTARGEHDKAAELVGEAVQISGLDRDVALHDVHQVVPTYIGMAHHLLGIEKFDEAMAAAEKGREIAEGTGYTLWLVHQLLPVLAEAYLWADQVERAAAVGAEMRAHSERIDHRLGLAWADACEALVRWKRGDPEGAIPAMRAAADELEAIPMLWHATRLRRQLSARLRDAGRVEEARAELDRVWKVCVRIGAGVEKERARRNYVELGLKPPVEPRMRAWGGLTPEELEIAKLVASGMTNKAVAAARASAVRTVGTHLYNIYKKLELGGPGARARLAVMMRESAQED
jgi:tetratricopeptide (TPR) repeat protein/DNA-binding CsgD family transcriptional regulator